MPDRLNPESPDFRLLNRFFAEITEQRIRRGVFHSVADLEKAIMDYLEQHNANPQPFVWTASASAILSTNRNVNGTG